MDIAIVKTEATTMTGLQQTHTLESTVKHDQFTIAQVTGLMTVTIRCQDSNIVAS